MNERTDLIAETRIDAGKTVWLEFSPQTLFWLTGFKLEKGAPTKEFEAVARKQSKWLDFVNNIEVLSLKIAGVEQLVEPMGLRLSDVLQLPSSGIVLHCDPCRVGQKIRVRLRNRFDEDCVLGLRLIGRSKL